MISWQKRLLLYWELSVQRVTNLEQQTEIDSSLFSIFDKSIKEKLSDHKHGYSSSIKSASND